MIRCKNCGMRIPVTESFKEVCRRHHAIICPHCSNSTGISRNSGNRFEVQDDSFDFLTYMILYSIFSDSDIGESSTSFSDSSLLNFDTSEHNNPSPGRFDDSGDSVGSNSGDDVSCSHDFESSSDSGSSSISGD